MGQFFPVKEAGRLFSGSTPVLRVTTQPVFPRLKKVFDSSATLRRLCEGVMSRRTVEPSSAISEHQRCISAARYALISGNSLEFQRLHRLYRGMPRLGARPDEPRREFWDEVLGASWQSPEYVPSGQAQDELRALIAARYALLPLPQGVDLQPDKLPYMLSLGWGMLHADMKLKPRAVSKREEMNEKDAEVLMARAFWNQWVGSWENAYNCYLKLFSARESQVCSVAEPHGGAMLLLAAIVAIRAHAPHGTVELWLKVCQEIMLRSLSEHDAGEQADICAFFDSMRMWDNVENRRSRCYELPPEHGPLASIPLAMGADAFVCNAGVRLPMQRLVRDILSVHERGLHLPAFYAATSLELVHGRKIAELAPLRALNHGFKPLFEKNDRRTPITTEARWSQLISVVDNLRGSSSRWLYWDITLDRTGFISSIEPRLVEGRVQTAGKKLKPEEVMDTTLVDCQDSRDMAMVALVHELGRGPRQGTPLLADALVGHPRIRIIEGSYHRPVQVVAVKPVIHVHTRGDSLELSLDTQQFMRLRTEEATLYITSYSGRMQALQDYFRRGPIVLDMSHTEYLRWLLARLDDAFIIEGELPSTLPPQEIATPEFVIYASVYDNGYLFDMDVRHHPLYATHNMPGQGERVLLFSGEEASACVIRDFDRELAAARAVIDACPVLRAVEEDDFQWLFTDTGDALQALHELGACGIQVQWQAEPALELVHPVGQSLRLSVKAEKPGWFEIGARLQVDEQLVLSLSDLLASYKKRHGHFLPLEGNRYLDLSPVLAEQLQRLAESMRSERKRQVLPMVAVPGFVAQWPGEPLPARLVARHEALMACESAPPPSGLAAQLRDYQLEGYRWLLARARAGFGSCLADDMGLGKTVQVLALMLELAPAGPSLVIAPTSLSDNWMSEAARHAPGLRMHAWAAVRDTASSLQAGDVVVATYGQLTASAEALCSVQWNLLALDEAQNIKNPSSRRAQMACRVPAAVRVCLTGTPVENSLVDLWSIMHFLNPMLPGSAADYKRSGKVDTDRLHRMVAPLILRRKKEDVLPQLPPITEVVVNIELSTEERALYESCRRSARDTLQQPADPACLLAELTRLRRLCCHGKLALDSFSAESSKLKMMSQLVDELLEADHSVLIFSQFTDVLDLAQETLAAAGVCTLRLDGATPPAKRGEHVRLFQEGVARVFLISLKAGGVGLNLTAADYVILLDPWWNPAVETQAAGRSHRIGQNNPVTLCRLIARNTVEERIMQLHSAKLELAESIMPEGVLPPDTLRELLM